jgi:hypothetical protein
MFNASNEIWYRLSPVGDPFGLSCDEQGIFLGGVPLLERISDGKDAGKLVPRPFDDLNLEFSVFYGAPVEMTSRAGGLKAVAQALNRGELALAKITAVQLQIPDLPNPGKRDYELFFRLFRIGMLKGDWDPDEHPRAGVPPNPGWFAPVPREPKPPAQGRYSVVLGRAIREFIRKYAKQVGFGAIGGPITEGILTFLDTFSPTELNQGEDRALAEMHAYLDPPKTLEELQNSSGGPGYDQHHIVLQTDTNIQKRIYVTKFGRDKIDDPGNLVYIPRFKHEEVNGYYEEKPDDYYGLTRREWIGQFDYKTQYEFGLDALRQYGILK